jgi:malonyl-CoA O-methyltransferase
MIDKKQMQRAFNHAAKNYDQQASLQQAVANNVLNRLEFLKINPENIVDLGAGTGYCLKRLRSFYPDANVVAVDIAENMLQCAQQHCSRDNKVHYLCSDMRSIALQSHSVDLVMSNLAIHWEEDIACCFAEVERILAPGGVFLFSTLGVDTLKECRQSWQAVDNHIHVHPFFDMHDVGDALMQTHFSAPVMDVEYITLMFQSVKQFAKQLKGLGVHNSHQQRMQGLTSRARWQQFEAHYEQCREADGLPATYEVIYGIAWKPTQPKRSHTLGEVRLDHIKRRMGI